jgi:organic hydroperoxide reductase OsmC/OhrA
MAREYRFPVDIEWAGGRKTVALVDEKEPLVLATPPEFKGTDPDLWSPEDVFVAAAGSCLAVTIAALAEHERLPLRELEVHAEGVVGRRDGGRFGFLRIEQHVSLETDDAYEHAARALVAKAEAGCLVAVSLDLPVETAVDIHTPVAVTAT